MSAFQFTFTAHAILFMAEQLNRGLVAAAGLFAAAQLLGIPARVLTPWISDRCWPARRARSLAVVMALAAATAVLFLALPPDAPDGLLFGVLGALGLFGIGWFPLYILEIAEMAPRGAIAATVSLATTVCMVAMSLVPLLFGLAVDFWGYQAAWVLLTAPVALLVVPLCRLRPRA
jgi:sugar phosphate permease